VGLRWPALAAVGLHFSCCGPALGVVGLRWASLACVGHRWPSSWAIVGVVQAKGGYVGVGVENGGGCGYVVSGDGHGGGGWPALAAVGLRLASLAFVGVVGLRWLM
jgi:hypothetical protein